MTSLRKLTFFIYLYIFQFKYKKRVYKTTPPDPVKMKKLHSSVSQSVVYCNLVCLHAK